MSANRQATTATTIGMEYLPAEIEGHSGVKRHEIYKRCIKGGRRIVGGGNGQYITATSSRFILKVKIEGSDVKIWTERMFRDELGVKRLTPKLRERIKSTIPKEVMLEKRTGRLGTEYWVLSEKTTEEWVERIRTA